MGRFETPKSTPSNTLRARAHYRIYNMYCMYCVLWLIHRHVTPTPPVPEGTLVIDADTNQIGTIDAEGEFKLAEEFGGVPMRYHVVGGDNQW